jgi:hypothetical protein
MLPSIGYPTRPPRLPAAENDTSADLGRSVRKLYWRSSEIGFGHSSNVNTVGDTDGAVPCACANSCAYSRVVGKVCQRLPD